MNIDLSRRSFIKLAGAGVVASSLGSLGFGEAEAQELAHIKPFRLTTLTETRNTCPYCSVACGIIMYSEGDARNGQAELIHIEGDVDHPTNRGTLCPKGAALKDFVRSESRLTEPKIRRPGSDAFEPISWDEALDRIARALKDDRDENLVQFNEDGVPVNRLTTTGVLAASATTNETAWATFKVIKAMGIAGFDNQARV
ncbi:formate dehydrogenase major subunit [Paracoccus isoporae]|uniref:Formate dehydrogenase major subunit n=3 Tax=Paracoccus isoporae TaxID=591205 RepID=A0A1G6XRY1_9RHOB|nr:formate dehydrogenase major subunit [Paracoccus isoporae]